MPASPYIRQIRESIGHDFLLLPAVTALTTDDQGRYLLVKTVDFDNWSTLGGAIDPDERPADAIRREALEEVGICLELVGLRGAVGGPDYRVTYPNGDRVGYVSTVFDAKISDGVPAADFDEISDTGWFSPDDMINLDIEPLSRQLLKDTGVLAVL